jgi:predicted secreted protein
VRSFTDPSTTIDLGTGETIEIVLEGNFTTGYKWELVPAEADVELVAETMRPSGDAPGSGGTQHFTLQARSSGSHSLRFVYRRPWEDAILDERDIQLVVS